MGIGWLEDGIGGVADTINNGIGNIGQGAGQLGGGIADSIGGGVDWFTSGTDWVGDLIGDSPFNPLNWEIPGWLLWVGVGIVVIVIAGVVLYFKSQSSLASIPGKMMV